MVLLDGLVLLRPLAEDHHGAALRVDKAEEPPSESVPAAAAAASPSRRRPRAGCRSGDEGVGQRRGGPRRRVSGAQKETQASGRQHVSRTRPFVRRCRRGRLPEKLNPRNVCTKIGVDRTVNCRALWSGLTTELDEWVPAAVLL